MFKAFAINYKDIVYFDFADIPKLIAKQEVVLSNRPGSPILLAQSVARNLKGTDFYEGDIVYKDGQFIGYLVAGEYWGYSSCALEEIIPITEPVEILKAHTTAGLQNIQKVRTPLKFKCNDGEAFSLYKIMTVEPDAVLLSGKVIDLNTVRDVFYKGNSVYVDISMPDLNLITERRCF